MKNLEMKRILSLILAIAMVISMTPLSTFATGAGTTTGNKITGITVMDQSGYADDKEMAVKMFDSDHKNTKWCVNGKTGWVTFKTPGMVKVSKMTAYHAKQSDNTYDQSMASNTKAYALQVFTGTGIPLEADYTDNTKWETVGEETTNIDATKETAVNMTEPAEYFRLNVTDDGATNNNAVRIYGLELFGELVIINPVNVSFVAGEGAVGTMTTIQVEKDREYTLPDCEFTKVNSIFTGWTVTGQEGIKQPGEKIVVNNDITLTANWKTYDVADTSYIDENGNTKTASAEVITADTVFMGGENKWYVVNSDVAIEKQINAEKRINLILADGATLNITGGFNTSELYVYGQTENTGKFNVTATTTDAISVSKRLDIMGGNIKGVSTEGYGVNAGSYFKIMGKATLNAKSTSDTAFCNSNKANFSGGTTTLEGGIKGAELYEAYLNGNAIFSATGRYEGAFINVGGKISISDNAVLNLKGDDAALMIYYMQSNSLIKNGGTINANGKFRYTTGYNLSDNDIKIPEGLKLNDSRIKDIDLYVDIFGEKFYKNNDFSRTITKKNDATPVTAFTEYGTYVVTFKPANGSESPKYSKEFAIKQAVNNTGTDKTVEYNGNTIDVSGMFTIDNNAGTATYSVTNGTGTATIAGSKVTVTKAGTINVKVNTAESDAAYAGEATAVLTVTPKELIVTPKIQRLTYAEDADIVNAVGQAGTTGLCNGHLLSSVTLTANVDKTKINAKDAVIKTLDDIDVTGNYNITYQEGLIERYHVWNTPVFNFAEDGKTCTVTRTDKNNSNETETADATVTSKEKIPATCLTKGVTTYTATVVFDKNTHTDTKDVTDIPALGHTWKAATYEWNADNTKCTATRVCEIDADHVETEAVDATKVTKAPTCESKGSTTYTAEFTNSWAAKQTKVVEDTEALGHAWGEPVITFAEDGKTATAKAICTNDGNHTKDLEVKVTSVVKTAATCEAKGVTTYTATVVLNDNTYTATKDVTDIEALGHVWDKPVITFAEDGKTATAKTVCTNDATHIKDLDVKVTSEVKTAATTEKMGVTLYTAVTELNGEKFTATKEVTDIPKVKPAETTEKVVQKKLDKVPESVQAKYDTVEKITDAMEKVALKNLGTEVNTDKVKTTVFDAVLMITEGGLSRPATKEEVEARGGITVVIPYPEGTNKDDFIFSVSHMLTVAMNGMQAGDIEHPAVTLTKDGIKVTLKGLSPVMIAYTEKPAAVPEKPAEKPADKTKPKTGDENSMIPWMMALAAAIGGTGVAVARKKKEDK